jgi:hypothetical protein
MTDVDVRCVSTYMFWWRCGRFVVWMRNIFNITCPGCWAFLLRHPRRNQLNKAKAFFWEAEGQAAVQQIPAFDGIRRLRVLQCSQHSRTGFCTKPLKCSSHDHHISLRPILTISTHLLWGINGPSLCLPAHIQCASLISPTRATCPANVIKGEAIPVTDRGGPQGCETSRLPHFLDNRLTDDGEVSLTRRPHFTPRKIPGTHFCWRLSRHQGHNAAGRIRSIKKSDDLIGNRTRDLPACSIVPQLC